MANRNRRALVPSSKHVLDEMKYEIAAELGLTQFSSDQDFNSEFAGELGEAPAKPSIDWQTMSTRNVGFVGGNMTKRLIAQAEQVLGSLNSQ